MNIKNKNIISVLILVVLIASLCFSCYYASKSLESNMGMGTPPEAPSGMNDSNGGTPPEKPSGDNSGTPPEKPSSDNNTFSDSNTSNDNNIGMPSDNNQMEKPDNMMNPNSSNTLETKYYVIIGVISLMISVVIMYLVLTKMNSLAFSEVFKGNDKKIIFILASVILTGLLTFGSSYATTNCLVSNTNNNGNMNGGPGGNNNTNISYSSKNEITSDTELKDETYESTSSDENAILVSGKINATIDNVTVNKTGDSDGGDNTSFYGTNSGIIAKDGSTVTIKNSTINTDATGANGVFSYGGSASINNTSSDNTTINISDSTITTKKDNSGGIMTTGGGIMNANNLTITTSGVSSAAIRSDRGSGTVNVDGGTYTTNGAGSPSIYSTADITVKNANLNSNVSEGIVIEGKNSVSIENVTLTDTNNKLNGQSTTYKNIFLYQSMSGDAANGQAKFTSKNSKIITNKGDSFYVTNTTALIELENNEIINNDSTENFLRIQKDSWGNSGSNGGVVTFKATNQDIIGNIVVDSISTLDMTLNESYFEGTINEENTAKSITLKLDKNSKIKLTGDSYVTSFENEGDTLNIDLNGYKLYVNGKVYSK